MFSNLKKQLQDNFNKLSKESSLFYVTIDRELIWDKYISGFNGASKQEHQCSCCRSFLRQFGGIVGIIDGKRVSIWDNIEPEIEYETSINNVKEYIHSLPITDVFYNDFAKCGTNKNLDSKRNLTWEHFYIELPAKFVVNKKNIDTKRAELRDNFAVLKRSLEELTMDSLDTTLDLIAQNSLYKGNEFEGNIKKFKEAKKAYNNAPNKEAYIWALSLTLPQSICKIRNTAIGTLLVNLSEGMELDTAVTKFESVVAPTNYKRPTALVTPKMVQQAKDKLTELGLLEAMDRRYANVADLDTSNLLFVDKSSELTDVFKEMAKDVQVSPKSLTKVEEISISDFLTKIVPNSKSIEVLLENRHLSNLVTVLTAQDKNAKTLFKWNNPFSWSYTGGITDSMKERVKALGGKVDGVLRFSIQWNEDGKSIIDLDAHAHEPEIIPNRGHIFYGSAFRKDRGNTRTPMTGQLDIDMINPTNVGIENISWIDQNRMKDGKYVLKVHNYSGHRNFDGVRTEVEFDGQTYEFSVNRPFTGFVDIAEVTYSKKNGFSIKSLLEGKQTLNSKEKWNVKTNQFTKVRNIMLSPNHWEKPIGNKHYMFILENCITDEEPRPFFNEFLKEEFNENRKVFEILGSKIKIPESKSQLSGVGFSDTQRNSLIVRVEGTFKRNLRVNF